MKTRVENNRINNLIMRAVDYRLRV